MENKYQNEFSMDMDDVTHSLYHYDEFVVIIEQILCHPNYEFTAMDFILKNPCLSKWTEHSLEQNLYFLEKIKIFQISKIQDYPVRKYKFIVNNSNFNNFKKLTENKFVLEIDYKIEDFIHLFNQVSEQVRLEWYDKLILHWNNKILSNCSRFEKVDFLIKERDNQIKQYTSKNNLLLYYDIDDLQKLGEKLEFAVLSKNKIPLNPNSFFFGLMSPLEILKNALYSRFKQKLQIDTLNSLIEKEYVSGKTKRSKKNTTAKTKGLNSNQQRVLKIIAEELEKGIQKTDAINYAYKVAGYKNGRQVWNIIKNLESGIIQDEKFSKIFKK